ncbi:MAG: glycogen debranching protein GlgX [candidate division Zixibacteria bacterium]|nr:glycogen debranching protein GlgX [candidate division Zixibacteria bacterium]
MDVIGNQFEIARGNPLPLGVTVLPDGINFAVFSGGATSVMLVLFNSGDEDPIAQFPLDPGFNRTGNVWHARISGLPSNIEYGYLMDRQSEDNSRVYRFDPSVVLIDPYARALSGGEVWGKSSNNGGKPQTGRAWRSLITNDHFDWEFDQPLKTRMEETIIYELHVRGFTRNLNSQVSQTGTYEGLIEKIPYLKELGITAVELLPVNEFSEIDSAVSNPVTGEKLLNYWGYHSVGFFAPKASYASRCKNGSQVNEFKQMVKEFHAAGIEVILDVVFNHTAEGDQKGPTISFRGLDDSVYYLTDSHTGSYCNYSGCGNTVNCNHPVVRDIILDCLRYWVTEMHIDGFRFDLASVLGRGRDGSVLANPPLLERIAADPVLRDTKIIAEAWDAAGLYQVGTFPSWGRWAEWNACFRDDIRQFVKGDPGMVPSLANRIMGSPDIYGQDNPLLNHHVNFVTCHDGFTLKDLVSYNNKHNDANGEDNRDGNNNNISWNCGFEGQVELSGQSASSKADQIEQLRFRQIRNFTTLLMLSKGVPMILAGDELGRSQQGNNNPYCQDNEISWIDWELAERNADLLRFFRLLIKFRKEHPVITGCFREHPGDSTSGTVWHGVKLNHPDLSWNSRSLALQLRETINGSGRDIYIAANAYWKSLKFQLPRLERKKKWHRVVDTTLEDGFDISEPGHELALPRRRRYNVGSRSVVVLLGK